jgi:hypothetical protein
MKPTATNEELREFYRFVGEKLKNGGAHMSPEDVVEEWRDQHPDVEFEDDTEAIQAAYDDMLNGDKGRPAEEVLADLRRRIEAATKR